jgi:GH15 family glucan-1,4-alpha-glucosidase
MAAGSAAHLQPHPTADNPRDEPASPQPNWSGSAIEDYALIGDCRSAALVGRDGSIDWLCWPRFDSPACFAALLGTADNGRWQIAPAHPATQIVRRYRPGTMILETVFTTDSGTFALIDFMATDTPAVVRIVEGRTGSVAVHMSLAIRFEYGSAVPWVTRLKGGTGIRAVAGPDKTVLRSDVPLRGEHLTTVADFTVKAGEQVCFVLAYGPSSRPAPRTPRAADALARTEAFWRAWSDRCTYDGPWADAVCRSLLTLKALSHAPTGGIVAAPTTSLPERIGGQRNWDYRFCWVRDATFTLLALMHAGYREEARDWGRWLHRSVAGTPAQIQTLYGLGGERWIPEWEVPWLGGYQGAKPVRVGNAASLQLQIDVYGELADALYQAGEQGLARAADLWPLQRALTEHLETVWQQPDESIWEVRGGAQHFTFSKVMAWVAMDRAVKAVENNGMRGPVKRWRDTRARIHELVCRDGFNAAKNSFMQTLHGESLDASLLLMPLVGFLPADDPRVVGTVEAIGRDLMVDGLVRRYLTHETSDGLGQGEGVFLACSFWYVDNLTLQGRIPEARAMFGRLIELCNDVGLLAEEYDPRDKRQLGNFPQAFSHLALINAALNLGRHHGPARQRRGNHHSH